MQVNGDLVRRQLFHIKHRGSLGLTGAWENDHVFQVSEETKLTVIRRLADGIYTLY